MESFLAKYKLGSTTMGERMEEIKDHTLPILVLCPEPGFKSSFFKNHGLDTKFAVGIEKYFWIEETYRKMFENASSMPDILWNMTYALGQDLEIMIMGIKDL